MSTFKQLPPGVKLLTWTPAPLAVMYEIWAQAKDLRAQNNYIEAPAENFDQWRADNYDAFVDEEWPDGRLPLVEWRKKYEAHKAARRRAEEELFSKLIFDYTQIPEMIYFTWWLEGVPRAFYDQAVRHRKTAIFARSQRVEEGLEEFARDKRYLTTPEIADHPERRMLYEHTMANIAQAYGALVRAGTPVEDARGILPLHLRTGFAWGTSLRDLVDIFRKRTCHLLQQTYWAPVMRQMREQVTQVDPALAVIFAPPCQRSQGCVSTHDAELRFQAVSDGRADLHPCQLWAYHFAKPSQREVLEHAVANGMTRWAKSAEEA